MSRVEIRFYKDERGHVPVLEWLAGLRLHDRRAFSRCQARLSVLEEQGHELRRPHCDYLRDGIYELRIRVGRSQLRILYFFHGRGAVVLTHALSKEERIQEFDLGRALARKRAFEATPYERTHEARWTDA